MTVKSYTLPYLFLFLRAKETGDSHLKKQQKERKKKRAVLDLSTRVLA